MLLHHYMFEIVHINNILHYQAAEITYLKTAVTTRIIGLLFWSKEVKQDTASSKGAAVTLLAGWKGLTIFPK